MWTARMLSTIRCINKRTAASSRTIRVMAMATILVAMNVVEVLVLAGAGATVTLAAHLAVTDNRIILKALP